MTMDEVFTTLEQYEKLLSVLKENTVVLTSKKSLSARDMALGSDYVTHEMIHDMAIQLVHKMGEEKMIVKDVEDEFGSLTFTCKVYLIPPKNLKKIQNELHHLILDKKIVDHLVEGFKDAVPKEPQVIE